MALLSPCWVPLKRVLKFPEVMQIYKRAGRGQGTGQGIPATGTYGGKLQSAPKGFLRTVQIWLQGETLSNTGSPPALPSWIRKIPTPGVSTVAQDMMQVQIDVTNIPGVRPLRKDGTWGGQPE